MPETGVPMAVPIVPPVPTVVEQKPLTNSVPLNMAIGAGAAGAVNYGVAKGVGDDVWPSGIAIVLNVVMQPAKKMFPFLKHQEWAIVFMLLLGVAVLYFFVFDRDFARALINGAGGVIDAIGNYKADKAAGLNVFQPADD